MRTEMLPSPRGPWSRWVLDTMAGVDLPLPRVDGDGWGDDVQLALYLCYEVQYGGLPGTEHLEWSPALVDARRRLEWAFESSLFRGVDRSPQGRLPSEDTREVAAVIQEMLDNDDGPSLSTFMRSDGAVEHLRDIIRHRSAYQLKEGDGHTAGVQRLAGRAKQLLVQIQAGEYGADGDGRLMHAALFADTMTVLGLDPTPNAYLDVLPGSALALSNLISLFGTNRRWRGALVGQLAAFEMTSVVPMQRYADGLDRLGVPARARRFYDVHVLADAEHEMLALEMVQAQCRDEPDTRFDVIFGVQSTLVVERRFAEGLFDLWQLPCASRLDRSALVG